MCRAREKPRRVGASRWSICVNGERSCRTKNWSASSSGSPGSCGGTKPGQMMTQFHALLAGTAGHSCSFTLDLTEQASAGFARRLHCATTANVSGAQDSIRIDILRWSTDAERDRLMDARMLKTTTIGRQRQRGQLGRGRRRQADGQEEALLERGGSGQYSPRSPLPEADGGEAASERIADRGLRVVK